MSQLVEIIIIVASVITALGTIIACFTTIHKWILRQNKQDEDIRSIKDEQKILTTGRAAAGSQKELFQIGRRDRRRGLPSLAQPLRLHLRRRRQEVGDLLRVRGRRRLADDVVRRGGAGGLPRVGVEAGGVSQPGQDRGQEQPQDRRLGRGLSARQRLAHRQKQ